MADVEAASQGNPALVILIVISTIVFSILGGAVYVWFYVQKNADQLGIKPKKKLSKKKERLERARQTQMGD